MTSLTTLDYLAPGDAGAADERTPTGSRSPFWRVVGSGVVFVLALVLLWPAQFGGITGLTVVSGKSMQPTYVTGDLVVSVKQATYSVGDIVSYTVPEGQAGAGGRVIHRIFSIDTSSGVPVYSSKGDNNPSVDPWTFSTADIMGHALFSLPSVGLVLGGVSNPIVVGLASGLLVTLLLWRIGSGPQERRHRKDPQGT